MVGLTLAETRMSRFFQYLTFVILAAVTLSGAGCRRGPSEFILTSVIADSVELNTSGETILASVNPIIVATFNSDVDPGTVETSAISLIQEFDGSLIDITITTLGAVITINLNQELLPGTLYKLEFTDDLGSIDGIAFNTVTYSFSTPGTFAPKGALAHWMFEGNADEQSGTFNPAPDGIIAITYGPSRNAGAGLAAIFDGDRSIIEIPNGDALMNTSNFTLSFWVKTDSDGHTDASGNPAGYLVMGLGAFFGFQFEISADFSSCNLVARFDVQDQVSVSSDLLFIGDGKIRDNGGWIGTEYCKNLTGSKGVAGLLKDKWAQVVCMYESSSRRSSLFINGEKMIVNNFNLWPEGDDRHFITGLKYDGAEPLTFNELAFGFMQSRGGSILDTDPRYGYDFITSNHFKGLLDDVRIYHRTLTEMEIRHMYDSEK
jgi:hypothetical protein